MSTPIDPICFGQDDLPCDCTYSTVAGVFTATTVATKVGNDFQFYGLRGINGATVTLNGTVIEISGGGASSASLQTAYNNGNQIIIAGSLPVDIQTVGQSAFRIRDGGNTGIMQVTSNGFAAGDSLVQFSNRSGIRINPPVANAAPTYFDPYTNILSFAPPSGVIVSTTTPIGAPANSIVYSYNLASILPAIPSPAATVTRVKIQIVGYSPSLTAMFSMEVNARLAPQSTQQALLGNISTELDPALAGLTVDVAYTANNINFVLIGGPNPGVTSYTVRGTAIITMMEYA